MNDRTKMLWVLLAMLILLVTAMINLRQARMNEKYLSNQVNQLMKEKSK